MKYVKQLIIILGITFIGEILNYILPLPVPSSIYGLGLMLTLLCTGVLKVSSVREVSSFLLEVMPIMFVPAAAGIIEQWSYIRPILLPSIIVMIFVTVIVMVVTGLVTQGIINLGKRGRNKDA